VALATCVKAAVIEVTSGGGVEPTYMFSDSSGNPVATLTGNLSNGDITASGDLKTGSSSLNDVASRLATLETSYPTYVGATLKSPRGAYGCPSWQIVSWTAYEANSPSVSTSQLSNGNFKPSVAGYYSCSAALFKAMIYDEIFDISLYKNGQRVRSSRRYHEFQAVGPSNNPARGDIVNDVTAIMYLDGVSDYVSTYNQLLLMDSGGNVQPGDCGSQVHQGNFASWADEWNHMTCHLVGV